MLSIIPPWLREVPKNFEGAPKVSLLLGVEGGGANAAWGLLAPAADAMRPAVQHAAAISTRTKFAAVELYAPLYLSNECTNKCSYCGFRYDNPIPRVSLSQMAMTREAQALAETGIRSVLLLTGEAPKVFGVEHVLAAVKIARGHFDRVAIEVFPMSRRDYGRMISAGATGITIYQETYDMVRYRNVHLGGRKRNFAWRLDAPRRAALAGFKEIGIGALLGLSSDWRRECLWLAHHAAELLGEFVDLNLTFSFPRMREASDGETPQCDVSDVELIHAMTALRLAFPNVGTVLSTRETVAFRNEVGPMIATKMSAGSSTRPGGYTGDGVELEQFSIADARSPTAVYAMLRDAGVAVHGYDKRSSKTSLPLA